MKSYKTQQGSVVHIIIIVVLVVAILGLLGFVFWQNFLNKPKASTDTAQTAQTEQTTDSTKTLSISEWDVKGTYNNSSDLTDVTYSLRSADILDLKANNLPTDCGGNNGVGSIERVKSTDTVDQDGTQTAAEFFAQDSSNASHVGDYYYFYFGPSAPCDPEGGAVQTALKEAIKELSSSFVSE